MTWSAANSSAGQGEAGDVPGDLDGDGVGGDAALRVRCGDDESGPAADES
jgi:hypothetical protein